MDGVHVFPNAGVTFSFIFFSSTCDVRKVEFTRENVTS